MDNWIHMGLCLAAGIQTRKLFSTWSDARGHQFKSRFKLVFFGAFFFFFTSACLIPTSLPTILRSRPGQRFRWGSLFLVIYLSFYDERQLFTRLFVSLCLFFFYYSTSHIFSKYRIGKKTSRRVTSLKSLLNVLAEGKGSLWNIFDFFNLVFNLTIRLWLRSSECVTRSRSRVSAASPQTSQLLLWKLGKKNHLSGFSGVWTFPFFSSSFFILFSFLFVWPTETDVEDLCLSLPIGHIHPSYSSCCSAELSKTNKPEEKGKKMKARVRMWRMIWSGGEDVHRERFHSSPF